MVEQGSRGRKAAWRPIAGAVVGGAVVVGTGLGVWASLNATASGAAESISSGTLKLTVANNGAGFSTAISNLAPTDIVNRYVDLTNGGTLDAQALTVQVAATGSSALITDATSPATTKALRVTINACTGGTWNPTTGACSGTTSTLLAATPVSGLSAATSLISGAVVSGAVQHLQISTQLPDQTETTVNGTVPTTTIQGQNATLTFTFNEVQRTGTTTTS